MQWRELKDIFRDVYIEHSFTSDPEDKERLLDICSEETQKLHMIDKEVKAAIAYAMTADLAVVMECGSLEEKRLAQHCCAHVLLLKGDAEEAYQARDLGVGRRLQDEPPRARAQRAMGKCGVTGLEFSKSQNYYEIVVGEQASDAKGAVERL